MKWYDKQVKEHKKKLSEKNIFSLKFEGTEDDVEEKENVDYYIDSEPTSIYDEDIMVESVAASSEEINTDATLQASLFEEEIIEEVPVVEEEPVIVEEPIVEETLVVEEEPVIVEEPIVEETPVVEEEPVIVEEPIVEETPVVEEEPVIVEEPIVEETPVVEAPAPKLSMREKRLRREQEESSFANISPSEYSTSTISEQTHLTGSLKMNGHVVIYGTILGDVECPGNLHLYGKVEGNIRCANIVMEDATVVGDIDADKLVNMQGESSVKGSIIAENFSSEGLVVGDLTINGHVSLSRTSSVEGNISAQSFATQKGALIKGKIAIVNDDTL